MAKRVRMGPTSTTERVRHVVADMLAVDVEEATTDAALGEDLGADSMDFVEIVMALEQEFGVTIDEDAVHPAWYGGDPDSGRSRRGAGTVGALVDAVARATP